MTRRPRFRKPATEVSLFPFLAVLICTMGGLIVLLVMVVQQARVYAEVVSHSAESPPTEQLKARRAALEDEQWRQDVLAAQREEKANELGDQRLVLSHLEEHLRTLRGEWETLIAQAEQLEALADQTGSSAPQSAARWKQLQDQIAATKRQLDELQRQAAKKKNSYAILPYEGPNATRRRPIYLECRFDGVTVHPEGIKLGRDDLEGPQGPGNPLAAVLRAVREYQHAARLPGEPYPLLVVRPDGAETYNLARRAMKSWDDQFGFELVEADLQLEFPQPDPALVQQLQQTVKEARKRQEILKAAMPREFQGETRGLVASRSGGFVPLRGTPGGRPGSRSLDRSRGVGERFGGDSARRGDPFDGGRNGGRDSESSRRSAEREGSPTDGNAQTPGGSPSLEGQPEVANAQAAGPGRVAPGGTAAAGGSSMSLADSRGQDWGLPNKSPGATGITRPIRVACLHDRLIILPEKGATLRPRTTLLDGPTYKHVDAFVSSVWTHVEDWGIALAGGYWKPVLRVEVGPGGEKRYQELRTLLDGSGLQISRKN